MGYMGPWFPRWHNRFFFCHPFLSLLPAILSIYSPGELLSSQFSNELFCVDMIIHTRVWRGTENWPARASQALVTVREKATVLQDCLQRLMNGATPGCTPSYHTYIGHWVGRDFLFYADPNSQGVELQLAPKCWFQEAISFAMRPTPVQWGTWWDLQIWCQHTSPLIKCCSVLKCTPFFFEVWLCHWDRAVSEIRFCFWVWRKWWRQEGTWSKLASPGKVTTSAKVSKAGKD